jgi:hydrogenase-4 component F
VIFIGFLNHFRTMYYRAPADEARPDGTLNAWCVVPMWLALIPLLVLGLWWPAGIWNYLTSIAQSLSPGVP